jgi:hypothetical protein
MAMLAALVSAVDPAYVPSSVSYLGGSGADAVYGVAVASDGGLVVATVTTALPPGSPAAVLVNGATSTSPAVILRLAPDGRTVRSATRVGSDVWDLCLGPDDSIHLALGTGGMLKLSADGQTVAWSKTASAAHRLDVGSDGDVAVLTGSFSNRGSLGNNAGNVAIYGSDGGSLGSVAGLNLTQDVAIDGPGNRVFMTGYKQYTQTPQLQVPYVLARNYAGTQLWKNYDFTYASYSAANRMADTRGHRLVVANGRVYAGFRTDGGNHLITSTTSASTQVSFTSTSGPSFPGGGTHSNFANANGASSLTIIGSYDLSTGAWLGGVVACARISAPTDANYGKMNAYALSGWGDLAVDQDGRVGFIGGSASGGGTNNTSLGQPYSHNPCGSGEYGGGPVLTVLSADFTTRLASVRVSSAGNPACLAMRKVGSATAPSVAFGGYWTATATSTQVFTMAPLQGAAGGGQEGFFGVFNNAVVANTAPTITVPAAAAATVVLP